MSRPPRGPRWALAVFSLLIAAGWLAAGPGVASAQEAGGPSGGVTSGGASGEGSAGQLSAKQQKAQGLWEDFSHYVLIARPDLASDAAKALMSTAKGGALLDAVETSTYSDSRRIFDRALKTKGVKQVARELADKVEQARLSRSRDTKRIAHNIELLSQGQRPFNNAVRRLRAAGQFAAPQLLQALGDRSKSQLHPYILRAMVAVGRPLTYPYAVALPDLNPVEQGEVARVLAEIGYPLPLPYLKMVMDDPNTDPSAKRVVKAAFEQIVDQAHQSADTSAAVLFVHLAQRQYNAPDAGKGLVGYDKPKDKGIVWEYGQDTGLVPVPVPGVVFRDVLTMRSARHALALNHHLDRAMSLWLTANLRRENNLPQGQSDPSYGENRRAPSFYAMLAGPKRLQDVLAKAMSDHDRALALDAINALRKTAGTDALVNQGAARQPLIDALTFPDARVRFRAALALARARPDHTFDGAYRVVPVLARTIRQSGAKYAVVLAQDQKARNGILALVHDRGYDVIGGKSLSGLSKQIRTRPGIDLIVVNGSAGMVRRVVNQTRRENRLAATPILALVGGGDQQRLSGASSPSDRVLAIQWSGDEALGPAIDRAVHMGGGQPLSDQQATAFALTALTTLREMALDTGDKVYKITDAQPALIAALDDSRQKVAVAAGGVLSLLDNPKAQRALADAALGAKGDQQVALLGSLAESATYFGNHLESSQTDALLKLVRSSRGDTALAAARAHGALSLPTSNDVKLIVQ